MAKIKKTMTIPSVGETGTFMCGWWECKGITATLENSFAIC